MEYKYEIYHKDSGVGISHTKTVAEALERIELYEEIDRRDGTYQKDAYDWRIDIGE